jgi:hypothetical protein
MRINLIFLATLATHNKNPPYAVKIGGFKLDFSVQPLDYYCSLLILYHTVPFRPGVQSLVTINFELNTT